MNPVTFLNLIKFEHTIFALPFAYLGMLLGARGWPPAAGGWPSWLQVFWVTVAMAAARSAAMAFNRYIDRHIDALNPRTANRELPTGRVRAGTVLTFSIVSLGVLMLAAWMLNPLAFRLALPAMVFLVGYSYTKRFTWFCHWILGATDGLAAAGGWIAVTGSIDPPAWVLWFAVTVWIAGFDLIYACQDVDFDRTHGVHSVPARFGIAAGLRVAQAMHVLTVLALAAAGLMMGLGWPYWAGVVTAAGLLVYEHSLVSPTDLSKLDIAFFNVNGYIAVIVFAATLAALWR
ncbi:MAG: 4-hydroxybenzoate octaprenyltransferase [Chloroflexi bacterium]|nr:MAG: 4-hydroxybenzoate octaprenyltransferase [Chloroflexota bacterium]